MGVFFSGRELVDIAIGIERNGASFYDSLAKSAGNKTAKGIYEYLAGEERKHIRIFQSMLGSVADYRSPETYTEEYDLYLKALVDSAIFPDEQIARAAARKVSNAAEAIQIALSAEKESILFYSEMRGLVRQSDHEVMDKIIEEERSHVRQLQDLKKGLDK